MEEIAVGAMCKVKGFEKFLSQVVAEGTREEMNEQLDEMDGKEKDKENELPHRKRKGQNLENGPSTKKSRTGNKPPQKNQTKTPSRQKKAQKKTGSILLVTSGPSTENSAFKLKSTSPPPPSPNHTSLSPALESDDPPPLPPKAPPLPSILSPKPTHSLGLPKSDVSPPAVSLPLAPPSYTKFEIPQADFQWYKNSPMVQPKKVPTPTTSSTPAIIDSSSSSEDSQGM